MDLLHTLHERELTHGRFAEVAETAQYLRALWRTSSNWDAMTASQKEALDMKATKLARIMNGDPNELDHWEDDAGYTALAAREIARRRADVQATLDAQADRERGVRPPLSELLRRVGQEETP